jgi:hypothetical protein
MNNVKSYLFYTLFSFICISIFSTVPALADSTVFNGYQIPHSLPWNDGTDTWTHLIARHNAANATAYDGNVQWVFYYLKDDYLTLTPNASNQLLVQSYGSTAYPCKSVTTTDILNANTVFTDGPTGTGASVCSSITGGSNHKCTYQFFSDRTIFSGASNTKTPDCPLVWTSFDFGEVAIPRVTIENRIVINSPDPAPTVILNPDTGEYVTVPDILSNPSGFVTALLTNLGIWVYKLILPDGNYFSFQFDNLSNTFEQSFPWVSQLRIAFDNFITALIASNPQPITLNGLNVGGNIGNYTVFNPSSLPDMSIVKTFLSVIFYIGTGFWIIRKSNSLFRA